MMMVLRNPLHDNDDNNLTYDAYGESKRSGPQSWLVSSLNNNDNRLEIRTLCRKIMSYSPSHSTSYSTPVVVVANSSSESQVHPQVHAYVGNDIKQMGRKDAFHKRNVKDMPLYSVDWGMAPCGSWASTCFHTRIRRAVIKTLGSLLLALLLQTDLFEWTSSFLSSESGGTCLSHVKEKNEGDTFAGKPKPNQGHIYLFAEASEDSVLVTESGQINLLQVCRVPIHMQFLYKDIRQEVTRLSDKYPYSYSEELFSNYTMTAAETLGLLVATDPPKMLGVSLNQLSEGMLPHLDLEGTSLHWLSDLRRSNKDTGPTSSAEALEAFASLGSLLNTFLQSESLQKYWQRLDGIFDLARELLKHSLVEPFDNQKTTVNFHGMVVDLLLRLDELLKIPDFGEMVQKAVRERPSDADYDPAQRSGNSMPPPEDYKKGWIRRYFFTGAGDDQFRPILLSNKCRYDLKLRRRNSYRVSWAESQKIDKLLVHCKTDSPETTPSATPTNPATPVLSPNSRVLRIYCLCLVSVFLQTTFPNEGRLAFRSPTLKAEVEAEKTFGGWVYLDVFIGALMRSTPTPVREKGNPVPPSAWTSLQIFNNLVSAGDFRSRVFWAAFAAVCRYKAELFSPPSNLEEYAFNGMRNLDTLPFQVMAHDIWRLFLLGEEEDENESLLEENLDTVGRWPAANCELLSRGVRLRYIHNILKVGWPNLRNQTSREVEPQEDYEDLLELLAQHEYRTVFLLPLTASLELLLRAMEAVAADKLDILCWAIHQEYRMRKTAVWRFNLHAVRQLPASASEHIKTKGTDQYQHKGGLIALRRGIHSILSPVSKLLFRPATFTVLELGLRIALLENNYSFLHLLRFLESDVLWQYFTDQGVAMVSSGGTIRTDVKPSLRKRFTYRLGVVFVEANGWETVY